MKSALYRMRVNALLLDGFEVVHEYRRAPCGAFRGDGGSLLAVLWDGCAIWSYSVERGLTLESE